MIRLSPMSGDHVYMLVCYCAFSFATAGSGFCLPTQMLHLLDTQTKNEVGLAGGGLTNRQNLS